MKTLSLCLLLVASSEILALQDRILVYAGPGVSRHGLEQTLATMKGISGERYKVGVITPEQLIQDPWEEETAVLVIPGGADIPYTRALNGAGNKKIRAFVEAGGSFFGICAGSYYAGSSVEFASGTDMEVIGSRELGFFPGKVRGPILAPYDYLSQKGARAAKISADGKSYTVYYNGGGYFVDAAKKANTEVIATYESGEAAIIACRVGKGLALLSAVHCEYDPDLLVDDDVYIKKIKPELVLEDSQRLRLVQALFSRLTPAKKLSQ